MDWDNIVQFNFTFAIPGGAWLKDASGKCNWHPFDEIREHKSQAWIDAQLKKQGWMTGCWVTCD